MASYKLLFRKSIARDLRKIPNSDSKRILARIRTLADDPRPAGSEKLSGDEKYRLRQGDYRILYAVNDMEVTVIVVKIGHRRDVHRR